MNARHVAAFGLALGLAGCTDRVLLHDLMQDAGPDVAQPKDAAPEAVPDSSTVPSLDGGCRSTPYVLKYEPRAPQLMILLDRSNEMQASLSGSTSRLAAAQSALISAIQYYGNKVKFGFEQFPPDITDHNYDDCQRDSCCAGKVLIEPRLDAYWSIRNPMQCGEPAGSLCGPPGYHSASSAALAEARDYFKARPSSDDRFVLLVTASEPTCSPPSDSREPCSSVKGAVSDLANLRVRVAVMSIGSSLGSKSCLAGVSSAPPYTPSNTKELSTAVSDLVLAAARSSCTFATRDLPLADATPAVYLGKTLVPPSEQDGWAYGDPSQSTMALSGSWCDTYLATPQVVDLYAGYTCSLCAGPSACPWIY